MAIRDQIEPRVKGVASRGLHQILCRVATVEFTRLNAFDEMAAAVNGLCRRRRPVARTCALLRFCEEAARAAISATRPGMLSSEAMIDNISRSALIV